MTEASVSTTVLRDEPKDPPDAPMVVINWSPAAVGLVRALARASAGPSGEPRAVICVGSQSPAAIDKALVGSSARPLVRYVQSPGLSEGLEPLAAVLADAVDIVHARSVIVLPDSEAEEPDAASRLTCVAVGRACAPASVPNILVEVEDPEAAYEFAGLGVATVFYPGYLRAALLAHACVDLGVFQFVYGLLQGRYRVRLREVPDELRSGTFLDAARTVEEDDRGRPVTPIGVQLRPTGSEGEGPSLLINPGPRRSLKDAAGLLVLVDA